MDIFTYETFRHHISSYGYTVININETEIVDQQNVYTVYSIELLEQIDDYSLTMAVEKHLKSQMGLFGQNIILELL